MTRFLTFSTLCFRSTKFILASASFSMTLLLAAPHNAQAAVEGSWSGDVTYLNTEGAQDTWTCALRIGNEPSTITIIDTEACFYFPESESVFEKQGQNLIYDGRVWGTFTEDSITLSEQSFDWSWTLNLQINADQSLSITEKDGYEIEPGKRVESTVNGVLTPNP